MSTSPLVLDPTPHDRPWPDSPPRPEPREHYGRPVPLRLVPTARRLPRTADGVDARVPNGLPVPAPHHHRGTGVSGRAGLHRDTPGPPAARRRPGSPPDPGRRPLGPRRERERGGTDMTEYDAIVVGARCAGSPTAMLLARAGWRVLLVDRATFPSDTVSTHVVQPHGVARLRAWGLLDQLISTGCPPIHTYTFDFGPVTISGAPGTAESPVAYAPRRIVLDKLLIDAAAEAGAEVRERFHVDEVLLDNGRVIGIRGRQRGGQPGTQHARRRRRRRRRALHGCPDGKCRTLPRQTPTALRLLRVLERPSHLRPVRDLHPTEPRLRSRGHQRRPHTGDQRLALHRVQRQQGRPRTPLPAQLRAGPGVRRPGPCSPAPDKDHWLGRTQLLSPALRPGLGAGRRRRLQPRLHHRPGHLRRLPRRRAVFHRADPGILWRAALRRRPWTATTAPAIPRCCRCMR